jgi:DNA polymerase-1
MLMSKLLTAGLEGPQASNALDGLAMRELGIPLDKTFQKSDWSAPDLSKEQLAYAAMDARVTYDLYPHLMAGIIANKLEHVAALENRAVPAFVRLSAAGVGFDTGTWLAAAEAARPRLAELEGKLNALATDRKVKWGSTKQVAAVFQDLAIELPITGKGNPSVCDKVLAAIDHPIAELLREHRSVRIALRAFADKWPTFVRDGRMYAQYQQHGMVTGRTTCKQPNMQQVPRDSAYRRAFVASDGYALVKGDYSQLQARIAAKVSGDAAMLAAYRDGKDLYLEAARAILGRGDVTAQERQIFKAVLLGLFFGQRARGLRDHLRAYGVSISVEQAEAHQKTLLAAYPGFARWYDETGKAFGAGESRTALGRRRLFDAQTPPSQRVNTPIQAADADGAKEALARLEENLGEFSEVRLVLFNHDEVVLEAPVAQALEVSVWLERIMIEAMEPILKPVPCVVDTAIGYDWADLRKLKEWPFDRPARPEPLVSVQAVLAPEPSPSADEPEPLPLFVEVQAKDEAAAKAARRQELMAQADADDAEGEGIDGPTIEEWRAGLNF